MLIIWMYIDQVTFCVYMKSFFFQTCFKCIYLEERLQATLSDLTSLHLVFSLLYSESTFYSESEVRLHPVPVGGEESLRATFVLFNLNVKEWIVR
jgi:hypothetical protein